MSVFPLFFEVAGLTFAFSTLLANFLRSMSKKNGSTQPHSKKSQNYSPNRMTKYSSWRNGCALIFFFFFTFVSPLTNPTVFSFTQLNRIAFRNVVVNDFLKGLLGFEAFEDVTSIDFFSVGRFSLFYLW